MARLSKRKMRGHDAALERLQQDTLTDDDKDFVFEHYQEAALHMNGAAGAFFTPMTLALDAVLELGYGYDDHRRLIDLCAGIGVLSYAVLQRYPNTKIVCVECNADYVAAGRKLVPEADWHCRDVTDLDALQALGPFDQAISNPPFGQVGSFRGKSSPRYRDGEAEYKVIDIAAHLAQQGVFIVPQGSSGFKLSGVKCYECCETDKYKKFIADTGISLDIGIGIDTSLASYQGWEGVKPQVEIVFADFTDCHVTQNPQQLELFALASYVRCAFIASQENPDFSTVMK